MPVRKETPRLEDYLEAIYHLVQEKGYASSVDVSDRLGVKPPTVTSMVKKLAKLGYLVHEPYRGMRLTDDGASLARSVVSRHTVISEFLQMIGVGEKVAYQDTEGIEHHIQPVTFRKIERLVEFLRKNPDCLSAIRDYIER
ncbi:MAG: transcriptional regulator MntR [Nitrososphaerota archaeon]|jgi:Mn-dependent DtxR family transcriptional regulator|nr:transcriptional regulator MntR [Nitrososphaerota archaeon]MDG6966895.1 transcriptional regulator MntR [Nitrososphaerota archaeon]MDG6978699.1 transcriptional regulator MntR [Nitrososphaerota archaeon]MDG7021100.1 transcriptional regulator MntR [Nitrososphaerota archaeon]MDG7021968.1 transcriptional regulator MntR [Nitrososphaerota archaeon]